MTETAHTPGPWVWRWKSCSLHQPGPSNSLGGPTYGKSVLTPTHDYDSGIDFEISDADARLIAEAPTLKADNERLRQINAELVGALEGIKAYAEQECDKLGAVDGYDYRSGQEFAYRDVLIKFDEARAAIERATS